MPPEQYFLEAPLWHFAFPIIASIFILYSGTAYKDVRRVLQILLGSEQSQQDSDKPRIQTKQE
jgi:hypothetical protein